jgi:hypothetical protein
MLWEALGRSGKLLGGSGRLWNALGRSGTLWDALGSFWEALALEYKKSTA